MHWQLETVTYSISPINKPQGRSAVNTDASETEWEKMLEKTPVEYKNYKNFYVRIFKVWT